MGLTDTLLAPVAAPAIKDIDIVTVMKMTKLSREKAIELLEANNGDVITAVMKKNAMKATRDMIEANRRIYEGSHAASSSGGSGGGGGGGRGGVVDAPQTSDGNINFVMLRTHVSEEEAREALIRNNGDLDAAIDDIFFCEDTVIDFIATAGADSDTGCTVAQVIAATSSEMPAEQALAAIRRLESRGDIYNTITKQHYKMTPGADTVLPYWRDVDQEY